MSNSKNHVYAQRTSETSSSSGTDVSTLDETPMTIVANQSGDKFIPSCISSVNTSLQNRDNDEI